MEDQSIFTNNQPKEISEGLQNFIDSMVEEIVLEGKPFDSQKKYLKKFSEKDGLVYNKLEADINTFLEILESLRLAFNTMQVKLAEEKGRECHISENTLKKLIKYSSNPRPPKPDKLYKKYGFYGVICLVLLGLTYFLSPLLFNSGNSSDSSEHQESRTDTIVVVKRDTIVKVQYRTEAEQMYRADAERGNEIAQYCLGVYYFRGEKGVQQSFSEAVKWYAKSAHQGYAPAQYQLGYCYEKGYGVSQSLKEAKRWYKMAADRDISAKANLERIEKLERQAKAPKVVELKIPAPSWNGKVLQGEFKDKYRLDEVKNALNVPITISLEDWLKENNLKMEYGSYTKNSNGKFEGKKPLNVELDNFPNEYKSKQLKRYEYRGNLCAAFYADKYWDYNSPYGEEFPKP